MATLPHLLDVQARTPSVPISLSEVGVTGVEKVISAVHDGRPQLFLARFECVVGLGAEQKGAHMSRFEEVVNEAIAEVTLDAGALAVAELAQQVAVLIRERQRARRAEVSVTARFAQARTAPISGIETQELSTLHGLAVASELGVRRLLGVSAQGMTACPCAQEIITAGARERLEADGFTEMEIVRILAAVPVATHNQRGIGTLYVGQPEGGGVDLDVGALVEIVKTSMSSEIFELMKRSDEAHVVERAHRQPRFVEDCVREMIRALVERFPALSDDAFLSARQENLETIHQHNVVAERHGLLGEIRRELSGDAAGSGPGTHTGRRAWLDAGR